MAYRFFVALIVGFWLVMSGLLVQLHRNPKSSELLSVPPAYVFGLMFVHGEESSLRLYDNRQFVGNVVLRPSVIPGQRRRALDFSGGISLKMPIGARQRLLFDGRATLDPALNMRELEVNLTMREPQLQAHVTFDGEQRVRYTITQNGATIRGEWNPSDAIPGNTGLDPDTLQSIQQNVASAHLTARRTHFKVRSESIDAYCVSIDYGTTTLAEIYLSELGQILLAKTAGGYTFKADDPLR